jgi:hypothetical protein
MSLTEINYHAEFDSYRQRIDDKTISFWFKYVMPSCMLVMVVLGWKAYHNQTLNLEQNIVITVACLLCLPLTPLSFILDLPYSLIRNYYFDKYIWSRT